MATVSILSYMSISRDNYNKYSACTITSPNIYIELYILTDWFTLKHKWLYLIIPIYSIIRYANQSNIPELKLRLAFDTQDLF